MSELELAQTAEAYVNSVVELAHNWSVVYFIIGFIAGVVIRHTVNLIVDFSFDIIERKRNKSKESEDKK